MAGDISEIAKQCGVKLFVVVEIKYALHVHVYIHGFIEPTIT